ncbi:telomere-associated protein RIF1 [Dromiciops gliroides]|uniref:telomere-associated protein RIF1 n=1 Tax=Dromiciops gliroides TaxID=33562 RepID=UPI001CC3ABDB|nr:telomere-associated protein RIF1 [Dromiciops gliroides]
MTAARDCSPLTPLLETLEDATASVGEQVDAYLTLASRLTGEEGKEFIVEIKKQLPRLYKAFKTHISSQNSELNSATLQAMGFCLYNPQITSGLTEKEMQELLSQLTDIATKSTDKNTRTRALWVMSKQTFPSEIVGKAVSSIITMLEVVFNKVDVHSMVVDYEALNVIIRLIEQAPIQMEEEAVRWAKLIIPLVVHSAQKVHLRGATALEMGMPLLLKKQQEVAAVTEQLMTSKLIPELQKLFLSKNETYVLKLWPLFVKLLGKTLHRSGSFINSLLQLEELGFRSGAPVIKKIAFIAWKSLIDNFALNPDILCSTKRLKLLMQPLSSIHVRTEALALTKLEVWWYLLMRLGPHLPTNFEQVCVPLIQSTISIDCHTVSQGTPSRGAANTGLNSVTPNQKSGSFPFGTPVTPRMNLSLNTSGMVAIPSIQLLGIEMLLHFLLGPDVLEFAKKNKLVLSLEPLQHPLISSPSFFCKHANILIAAVQDSFVAVGKDASDAMIYAIWKDIICFVKSVIESGNKKERQGSEVLTLLLQSLKSIVTADAFPVSKALVLMEITIKGLPQKVLGSPAYQVANMDLLNGTPALFLIQLIFSNNLLECCVADERFFQNLETLVGCVLTGPTSPLAFSDSVLNVINQNAKHLNNKEHLWRMWSILVNPLTELINQTNEVNQGDALEHNFSAVYSALMLPIMHIFPAQEFPLPTMKSLLRTWSELYRTFARCAALVPTAEENLCCDELCLKMMSGLDDNTFANLSFLDRIAQVSVVIVECINFSPYSTKHQPQIKLPQTPTDWSKKKKEPLGKLTSLFKVILKMMDAFHNVSFKDLHSETLLSVGSSIISIISNILGHVSLPSVLQTIFATLTKPLALLYENSKLSDVPKVYNCLNSKLEKLLGEIFKCLQFRYNGTFNSELLEQLSPLLCIIFLHKNKQIRKQSVQFWNDTFAKETPLEYPEELKTVLKQAKQNCLLLLPGFEVEPMEESSGLYSEGTENSQLGAKISGIEIQSRGKQDFSSLHAKNLKEKDLKSPSKMKLEFLSPKLKKDVILEECSSIDFVFIPPNEKETKERILTEHQKEVLRTKRSDIPTLYNNLDVSQDSFSYHSQEETMENPSLTEEPKEESDLNTKEGEAKTDSKKNTEDITVDSGIEKHPEKPSIPKHKVQSSREKNNLLLNIKKHIERNASKIVSKEPPGENTCISEQTSNTSSSPVSSGPISRRQSFITLEKFDTSENRPFSPSILNTVSGAVSVSENQENMDVASTSMKTNTKEINISKPDREKITSGTKKIVRKPNKTEHIGSKRPKLLRSEQEKNSQESGVSIMPVENKLADSLDHTEDTQDTLPQAKVLECDEVKFKHPVESLEMVENITEGNDLGNNLESKENTPPEVIPTTDQISNDDGHIQVSSNQKTLRRSSRRRSDVECTPERQDKENNQLKKERRKEEERSVQKKLSQMKDDGSQKQKPISEKNTSEQELLNKKASNLLEKTSEQSNVEINKLKSEFESIKSNDDFQDSGSDKSSQKPLRGRTRYQTRRASQGLLSSIENSESDSSETKEEISNKKRSGKWKNKSSSLENENTKGKIGSKDSVGSETKTEGKTEGEASSELDMEIRLSSQTFDMDNEQDSSIINDSVVSTDASEVFSDIENTNEKSKMSTFAEDSVTNSCGAELILRTRNVNKKLYKQDSIDNSAISPGEDVSDISDTSLLSEKSLQAIECLHKRSRRVRRSKSCDCCGEKSKLEEKFLTSLKNTDNCDVEINEPQKLGLQATEFPLETCVDTNLEVKPLEESCTAVVPLLHSNETEVLNDSMTVPENELKENSNFEDHPPLERVVNFENKTCVINNETNFGVQEHSDEVNKNIDSSPPIDSSQDSFEQKPVVEITREQLVTPLKEEINQHIETKNVDDENNTLEVKAIYDPEADISEAEVKHETDNVTEIGKFESSADMDVPEVRMEVDISEKSATVDGETPEPKAGVDNTQAKTFTDTKAGMGNSQAKALKASAEADVLESLEEMNSVEVKAESGTPEKVKEDIVDTEETKLDRDQVEAEKINEKILEKTQDTSENVEEPSKILVNVSELITEESHVSPQKLRGIDTQSENDSPSGMQTRCIWSPLASPSTSILKRGVKRQQEDEAPSPLNKVRRVSFADPIYQEGLADDIDRRSPVVRSHSSHSSNNTSTAKSIRSSPAAQSKRNTTSTKGFLFPGSRSPKFKSSKKCLIAQMTKESLQCSNESIYPALLNCGAPVDIILPQITTNIWARGLGQLIRAKNIKTIGDLCTLTAAEIKTLPVRSPKVSNVKKVLRIYHEQQMKSRGLEEITLIEVSEKPLNGMENKPISPDEETFASDLIEPVASDGQQTKNLVDQISALALQLNSEDLHNYSGSQLFEMQEKLGSMTDCIMKNLQSRWRSPPHESST